MIVEGLVSTLDPDGRPHLAAMGPELDPASSRLVLRPFESSQTLANLRRRPKGVFHIIDDALLLARTVTGQWDEPPQWIEASGGEEAVLADACRWYAFRVEQWVETSPRLELSCTVVGQGRHRDFLGWNRAKHAVLELAILATRVGIVPDQVLVDGLAAQAPLVQKTGGPRERQAFSMLEQYIRKGLKEAGRR